MSARPTRSLVLRYLPWIASVALGIGVAIYFRSSSAAASADPRLAPAPARAASSTAPDDPARTQVVEWTLDFGPRLEVDAHWAFYESKTATGARPPETVVNEEGRVVMTWGSPQIEHDHEGVVVDTYALRSVVEGAQRVSGSGPMPPSAMRISVDPNGWLEYREVLGWAEDKTTRGVILHDRALLRSLHMYAITWDRRGRVPDFDEDFQDGGYLTVSESSPNVARLVFEARSRPGDPVRHVVGKLLDDGTLVVWAADV